jgi:Protein of unknown function (DUF3667)
MPSRPWAAAAGARGGEGDGAQRGLHERAGGDPGCGLAVGVAGMKRTSPPDEAAPAACANCGQAFHAPTPHFCPACGQESRVRAPKLSEFLQQFGGAYLSTEGALWRTLWLLLRRPGELTVQYLRGRRRHYVLPLRLYLTISVVVLLAMRLLAGSSLDQGFKFDLDLRQGNSEVLSFGPGMSAGMKDGQFYCRGYPAWVCKRLQRRLDVDPQGLQVQAAELSERAISNVGLAMFFVLPVFAAALKVLYLNRRLRYTEHLVFALHLHAFWFLMLLVVTSGVSGLAGAAALAVPLYAALAMGRVYQDRWWTLLLRGLVLFVLYLTVLGVAVVGVAIGALLS